MGFRSGISIFGMPLRVARGLVLARMHACVPLKSSRVVWQELSTWP